MLSRPGNGVLYNYGKNGRKVTRNGFRPHVSNVCQKIMFFFKKTLSFPLGAKNKSWQISSAIGMLVAFSSPFLFLSSFCSFPVVHTTTFSRTRNERLESFFPLFYEQKREGGTRVSLDLCSTTYTRVSPPLFTLHGRVIYSC